jgi:hypothetical protein
LAVHRYRRIRTNECAIDATRAIVLDEDCEPITIAIDLIREAEAFLGARLNAQLATLTNVFLDDHRTMNHRFSRMKISLFFPHSGANPVPRAISLKNDDADKKAKTIWAELA